MNPLTTRFLSTFNQIEKHLYSITKTQQHTPFSGVVERAATQSAVIRQLKSILKDFADLRNVLVHQYDSEKEIAIPSVEAVADLEDLAEKLLSPPTLLSLFAMQVEICHSTDPVGTAAKKMHSHSFSQLPVYENDRMIGLLTAETIARWLAVRLEGDIGMLEEEPINKVLPHQENQSYHVLMGREATVFDALEEFEKSLHSGKSLDAIVLTHSGKATEAPLAIITISDMPKLVKAKGKWV